MLGYARMVNQSRGDLAEYPLRAGELVQLRSGSPKMQVEEITDSGRVNVVWTDRTGMPHRDNFPPELLQRSGRSFFGRRR
jgi:uncharacterized protein YodC (DUF2158 family)